MPQSWPRRSISVEDYVKVIYSLDERDASPVTTSRVAERLGVSTSSASGMIRKLAADGLAEHARYGDVRLTADGTKIALEMLRRHRLIELYLVRALGYSWDEVHDEAEVLEHAVSEHFLERIAEQLGNPLVDPHGDPIPTRDGTVVDVARERLARVPAGIVGVVVRVDDDDPELLRYLAKQRVSLGERIEVLEREPFGGPLVVRVGGPGERDRINLGLAAAEAVWIARGTA